MPELPEVETIRLGLQRYIVGKTIENVDVRLKKIVSGDTKNIIGAKVVAVKRFGKGLVIDLDNGYSIAVHIKLTGQLIYRGREVEKVVKVEKVEKVKIGGELPNKWTHLIFKLKIKNEKLKITKGSEAYLYYNDLRQFGWIKIIQSSKLKDQSFFRELGPEPPVLSDYSSSEVDDSTESRSNNVAMKQLNNEDSSRLSTLARTVLTLEVFKQILSKSNVSIKPLLMDQKKMAGVGNIYANDALFEAKINPSRKAKSLSGEEIKNLYNAILKVLKMGLKYNGATELNFVNVLGQEGGYQNHFLVYGREKEPCKACGSKIQKIKLGGRGTYFCPACQR